MGGIAAPRRTEVSPDFRVRDVVPEERRERTVSFISDPHHSPTHAVNRSHFPLPHSAMTASNISSCQASWAWSDFIGRMLNHHLSWADVERLLRRGVVGGSESGARRLPLIEEAGISVSSSRESERTRGSSLDPEAGFRLRVSVPGGSRASRSSKELSCLGQVSFKKSSNDLLVARCAFT